ncbi:hypothetical protein, partial [Thermomonas sp.]|uniref:hypothetical protein n=1 Tax=Thermomonas sp. TaxID=1971895 RepID=UPI0035ADF2BB
GKLYYLTWERWLRFRRLVAQTSSPESAVPFFVGAPRTSVMNLFYGRLSGGHKNPKFALQTLGPG